MIKNIVFDFGDVFINLDKGATARMLIRQGFAGITPDLLELFRAYEKGQLSTESFISRARNWVPEASPEELRVAWNAILLDFPEYRLEFIQALCRQGRYRTFLLSNTNEMHLEHVAKTMGPDRYQVFINCFEACYFSHKIQMRKPDREIFETVLNTHDLIPEETLFIDDTLEHIETAAGLGLHTWHLQVGEEDVIQLDDVLTHD